MAGEGRRRQGEDGRRWEKICEDMAEVAEGMVYSISAWHNLWRNRAQTARHMYIIVHIYACAPSCMCAVVHGACASRARE